MTIDGGGTRQPYEDLTDAEWRQLLLDSAEGTSRLPMPAFPPVETQAMFVGSSGASAISEAWKFYMLMRERTNLTAASDVLDFGCGWGRFARMFLRNVAPDHIWLADSWDLALQICEQTGVPGRRVRVGQLPPTDLPSATFDLAYAYSVFSHLSPKAHLAWRVEFSRVMKPGGLLFITTEGRWFLDYCRRLREHPETQTSLWHRRIAASFIDYDAAVSAYDQGDFLYARTTPDDSAVFDADLYGDAVVPRSYFEREWSADFELAEFIADPARFPQAVCILRRR